MGTFALLRKTAVGISPTLKDATFAHVISCLVSMRRKFITDHMTFAASVHILGGSWEPGQLVGKSAGLVIERLPVRISAGAAGEFLLQS